MKDHFSVRFLIFLNFLNLLFVVVAQEKEMELETLREKNRRDTEGLNKKLQV